MRNAYQASLFRVCCRKTAVVRFGPVSGCLKASMSPLESISASSFLFSLGRARTKSFADTAEYRLEADLDSIKRRFSKVSLVNLELLSVVLLEDRLVLS